MITPDEYIKTAPAVAWMHITDVLKHVLKGDFKKTIWKDPNPNRKHFEDFRAAMEARTERDRDYEETLDRTVFKKRKAFTARADSGEIDLEGYINGEAQPFEDNFKKPIDRQAGVTMLIDACIPWSDRGAGYMVDQHAWAYQNCLKLESEGVPARVIATLRLRCLREHRDMTLLIIIKDWNDPIFPGIWGAFKTCRTTNDFTNVVADFLIGMHDIGNGHVEAVRYGKILGDEQVLVSKYSKWNKEN